jgi:hypothetical protein
MNKPAILFVLFAAACSSDETTTAIDDHAAAVSAACDHYEAIDAQCGYDKFDDRAHCESSFGACTDADLARVEEFYDCLDQCMAGEGGNAMSVEDLSAGCQMQAFGEDEPGC